MNKENQRISNNILKAYGVISNDDIEKARGKAKRIGELDKSGKNVKTADGWKPVKTHGHKVIHESDKNEWGVHAGYLELFKTKQGARKATYFEDVDLDEVKNVTTPVQKRYLDTLPVHSIRSNKVPHYNPSKKEFPKPITSNYILENKGSYYHVETQGFDYPRYIAKLKGYIPHEHSVKKNRILN